MGTGMGRDIAGTGRPSWVQGSGPENADEPAMLQSLMMGTNCSGIQSKEKVVGTPLVR